MSSEKGIFQKNELIEEMKVLLNSDEVDVRSLFKVSNKLSKLDPSFQSFTVDAKTLIHLGRDSIKDHTTALIELVKNSYDADALNLEVNIYCQNGNDLIRVADNGFGMTRDQLINNWLRIGFSEKRQSKSSELGRRKTGEKGIGRISTDRLGAQLELVSLTENDGLVGLRVNWDDFDIEGKDVFDIDVEMFTPQDINVPNRNAQKSKTGTEIKVTKLRQPWSTRNIENLFYELSTLTPPFQNVTDFEVSLDNDVNADFSKKINVEYQKAAEIELTTIFDGKNEVYYLIKDKVTKEETVDTISLSQFYTQSGTKEESSGLNCGPVEVNLMFFLREGASVIGTNFKLNDLRDFLDNNAGVKIYRDQIAVKPYGFPKAQLGYDWLGLGERKAKNPAGVSRSDEYAVSPNQLVGAVFIKRDDNTLLTDSAAREGLVESDAFYDLKSFVMASLKLLESHRAKIYQKKDKNSQKEQKTNNRDATAIKQQLSSVKEELDNIRHDLENEKIERRSLIKPITTAISHVDIITNHVDNTINDLLDWQRTLGGLATMGISSAVFGHETEGSISQFQGSTSLALKLLKTTADFNKIEAELQKAFKHSKKIAAWGNYALTRLQREKRRKANVSIAKTIEGVVNELKPVFESSSIEITLSVDKFYTKSYQMDIESILVNLLTNSYTACLQKGGVRQVLISSKKELLNNVDGFYFSVADTGPGIAKEFMHRIFDPLFSTKTIGANESKSVGTGLGLTVVKSIVDDLGGSVDVDQDPILKGARFKVWLPKES